jgi:hypothetical protein
LRCATSSAGNAVAAFPRGSNDETSEGWRDLSPRFTPSVGIVLVTAVLCSSLFLSGSSRAADGSSPPSAPTLIWSDSADSEYPANGTVVDLEFNATFYGGYYGSEIGAFLAFVYYSSPGSSGSPNCGNAWVTVGCSEGQALSATPLSTVDWYGSFNFTVTPPSGDTEISITLYAVTDTEQAGGSTSRTIFIASTSSPGNGGSAKGGGNSSSTPVADGISPTQPDFGLFVASIAFAIGLAVVLAIAAKTRSSRRSTPQGVPRESLSTERQELALQTFNTSTSVGQPPVQDPPTIGVPERASQSSQAPSSAATGFCPFCGEVALVGHAFCRKCGKSIARS